MQTLEPKPSARWRPLRVGLLALTVGLLAWGAAALWFAWFPAGSISRAEAIRRASEQYYAQCDACHKDAQADLRYCPGDGKADPSRPWCSPYREGWFWIVRFPTANVTVDARTGDEVWTESTLGGGLGT